MGYVLTWYLTFDLASYESLTKAGEEPGNKARSKLNL